MVRTEAGISWLEGYRTNRLEKWSGDDMSAPAYHLFLMSQSLVEVVPLIEHYKRCEAIDACDPRRFVLQDWAGRTGSIGGFYCFYRPAGAVPVVAEPLT